MRNAVNIYYFQICLFFYLCQSRIIPFVPRRASNDTSSTKLRTNPSAPRKVYVVTDLHLSHHAVSLKTGHPLYGGHAQMLIDGTESDGPLIIEIGISPIPRQRSLDEQPYLAIRTKDLGAANTGKPIRRYQPDGSTRFTHLAGETVLANVEVFDHKTGKGLLVDAWMEDPVYSMGTNATPNTCFDLIERVLGRMNLSVDPLTRKLFDITTEYYTSYSREEVQRVQDVASLTTELTEDHMEKVETLVYNVDFVKDPAAPSLVYQNTYFQFPSLYLATGVDQQDWEAEDIGLS